MHKVEWVAAHGVRWRGWDALCCEEEDNTLVVSVWVGDLLVGGRIAFYAWDVS